MKHTLRCHGFGYTVDRIYCGTRAQEILGVEP